MRIISKFGVIGCMFLAFLVCTHATAQTAPITLQVDAREAPRRIFHAQLTIPAKPGPLTLFYPKWLTWAPIGPIKNLVSLKMTADGRLLPWRRDEVDTYAFHANVPGGASTIEVSLDYVTSSKDQHDSWDPIATDQLLVLNWNLVTLYPAGRPSADYTYRATLLLPEGWKFGTVLPLASQRGGRVEFEAVSLDTLIDSPVIAGAHFRAVPLPAPGLPPAEMDIVADHESALAIPQKLVETWTRLMQEAEALFGAHHYRSYHFLVTLSDHMTGGGAVEHHESSDDRYAERALTDDRMTRDIAAGNLTHELVHSWNGKYRRPAGIATPEYQQPMKDELLWVYEGLTEYLGRVLHARIGLQTPEAFREGLASDAAAFDHTPGRLWRPLVDTAVATSYHYPYVGGGGDEWASWRRDNDFYDEGALIWLEADVIIRQQSGGHRSLDDFCHSFFGPPSGPPMMKPYTFDDLVAALNQVVAYDWRGFFQKRVYDISPHTPLGGIEQGGWKLIYNQQRNYWDNDPLPDLSYSIGMTVQTEKDKYGAILDIVPGAPAAEAGIAPGMKLVAVNGQPWSPEILLGALSASGTPPRLELLVENAGFPRTYVLRYGGGPRYPHLERDPSRPDLLAEIIKPRLLSLTPTN